MISGIRFILLMLGAVAAAACTASAQYDAPRLVYGFFVGTAAKAGLFQSPKMRYTPWGEVNVGMSIGLTGAGEHAITARLHLQNSWDNITHRMGADESYTIESLSFLVNPEVGIPLLNRYRESRLELLGGIGADILLDQTLVLRNVMGYYAGTFLESLDDSVRDSRRGLVPFATLGVALRFHRRASIVIRLRQDARNLFEPGSQVTLYSTTTAETVNLSVQATRLLIGCQITIGKIPEIY